MWCDTSKRQRKLNTRQHGNIHSVYIRITVRFSFFFFFHILWLHTRYHGMHKYTHNNNWDGLEVFTVHCSTFIAFYLTFMYVYGRLDTERRKKPRTPTLYHLVFSHTVDEEKYGVRRERIHFMCTAIWNLIKKNISRGFVSLWNFALVQFRWITTSGHFKPIDPDHRNSIQFFLFRSFLSCTEGKILFKKSVQPSKGKKTRINRTDFIQAMCKKYDNNRII